MVYPDPKGPFGPSQKSPEGKMNVTSMSGLPQRLTAPQRPSVLLQEMETLKEPDNLEHDRGRRSAVYRL